jgi:DNA-binding MarR family transcriptional regulator
MIRIGMASAEAGLVQRWRDVLACYGAVSCALDKALQDGHDIGMSEFEALDRLVDTGRPLKMLDLAAEMYLSQSALSRTVARLEKGGLVARKLCEDDRRCVFVELTEAGRRRHAEASQTQRAVLAEHLC